MEDWSLDLVMHPKDLALILYEKLNWYGDVSLTLDENRRIKELSYMGKSYNMSQLTEKTGINFNNVYLKYIDNIQLWKELYGKKEQKGRKQNRNKRV